MMPAISTNAGLSQRYANHYLRATTVHILDSNKFSGRHVTSITGHKSESSLKTYTGYTAPNIKRKMSETISNTLRPEKQSNTDIEIDKENDIHLINSDLVPLSNSQYDTLVSDVFSGDPDMDDIIRTIDTAQIPTKCTNNITNVSANVNTNFPMPVFHKCTNITINFNFIKHIFSCYV